MFVLTKFFTGKFSVKAPFQIFLMPLHAGNAMQPQNEPYFPCRATIGSPQSGHAGAFALAFACEPHTGCFSEL